MTTPDSGGRHFTFRTVAVLIHVGRVLGSRAERDDFWALPAALNRMSWR